MTNLRKGKEIQVGADKDNADSDEQKLVTKELNLL